MNRHVVRDTVVFVTLCLGGLVGLSTLAVAIGSAVSGRMLLDLRVAVIVATSLAGGGLLWRYRSGGGK